jgi:RND superfamily putative drug exporter
MTLLPAVLSLLGDRIEKGSLARLLPKRGSGTSSFWTRSVRAVMRRPGISLVATAGLLIVAAVPYFSISTGAAGVSTLPTSLASRQGFEVLAQKFSVGQIAPAHVAVTDPAEAKRIVGLIAGDPRYGTPTLTGTVLDVPVNADATSPEAVAAVRHLRILTDAPIGGQTAQNVDYFDIVDQYLPIVVAIVLGLSFLVLLVAFRSIVVPFVAIAMNLLSVGAAYGLLVLVTQQGHGAGLLGFTQVDTIEAWVPLFLFSVLFGLSMDYHVFLLSRIREHWLATGDVDASIEHGIVSSARLITGAALIMVAVFGGFAMGDLVMFQQMGFGLAVAVLVDATLVRTILVPATMKLLGRWNWYLPSFLHWLPNVSVEGPVALVTAG